MTIRRFNRATTLSIAASFLLAAPVAASSPPPVDSAVADLHSPLPANGRPLPGQPLGAHGNPVPRPVPQPTFPRPPKPRPAKPGELSTAGSTTEQVVQQARKAQGAAKGKPRPKKAGVHRKVLHPDAAAGHVHPPTPTLRSASVATAAVPPATLPATSGGRWTLGPTQPSPNIHSVLLNTGKVLLIAGSGNRYETFAAGGFTTTLWNPVNNSFKAIATPYDMFCAGHVTLRDGRVLVTGGTTAYPAYDSTGRLVKDWTGSKKSYVFDPIKEIYQPTSDLVVGRWYPSLVRLGDDRVVGVGGLDDADPVKGGVDTPVNEIFTPKPGSTWDQFLGGTWATLNRRLFPQYAQMILTDQGRLFYTGASSGNNGQPAGVWDPIANTFTEVPGLPFRWQRNASGSVLLPPAQDQKVLTFGGGDYELPTVNDSHIVDLKAAAPAYRPGPPIANPKMYVGAVILPDYTVLQTNGAARFREQAVKDAQIYHPRTNTWTTVNPPSVARLYHSTAILLPDGRVATAGSQELDGTMEPRIELYEPPYLFKGQRPTVTSGPTYLNYDQAATFTWNVTTAPGSTISKLSLLRPSATTHSTDTEQRLVDLPFTRTSTGVTARVPVNRNLVPPGWYMLTATDDIGRPSVAKWVSLN